MNKPPFGREHIRWNLFALLVVAMYAMAASQNAAAQATYEIQVDDAEKTAQPPNYIRLTKSKEGKPLALQTATVRFVSDRGNTTVDLIGVVHVGDQKYYEAFNEMFKGYDALLYELVAPEGTRVPKGGRGKSSNPIAMMHGMAQSMLGLASQLDHVDYTPDNFVHADMSPEDMAAALKKRGQTPMSFGLRALADLMDQATKRAEEMQAQAGDGESPQDEAMSLFSMLTDKNAGSKMKLQMAEQFGAMSSPDSALGSTINQLIVQDRNGAAMKVLQRELAAGQKKIGIFYGAAHMPDFEKRLVEDFGLRRQKETWQTAWDLTIEAPKNNESPLGMIMKLLDQ